MVIEPLTGWVEDDMLSIGLRGFLLGGTYKVQQISSGDLLVKRLLKMSWDFVRNVRLVVTRGVDLG